MDSAMGHIGEETELYVLGDLADDERERIERHALTCPACARRIGEAEETLAQMIVADSAPLSSAPVDLRVRFERRMTNAPAWIGAVAAVVIAAILAGGLVLRQRPAALPANELAMSAMLAGHFVHAPFIAAAPDAPAAKAIYAREGGWVYVLVAAGTQSLDVAVIRGGRLAARATVAPSNATRSAFLNLPGKADEVRLLDRGRTVATARLVY